VLTFEWIAAAIVIGSMLYLTFALTVPEWLDARKKGHGVSLLPERGGRHYPMWVQVAMMALGLALCVPLFYYLWVPFWSFSESTGTILGVVGLTIYLCGFGFMLWARRTLGKNWGVSTSLEVKLRDDHELIQSGPYALVRHPMYGGAFVLTLGLLLLYPMWVILVLGGSMIFSLTRRARREERALAERFGEAWGEYRKRTRFLIPFVW
jgi:protein-S-isoprenylcysteine O-methyltransferase Ste14